MSAPSQYEPNELNESEEEHDRLYEEREAYERALCKRIHQYDPELALEVLSEFGLS